MPNDESSPAAATPELVAEPMVLKLKQEPSADRIKTFLAQLRDQGLTVEEKTGQPNLVFISAQGSSAFIPVGGEEVVESTMPLKPVKKLIQFEDGASDAEIDAFLNELNGGYMKLVERLSLVPVAIVEVPSIDGENAFPFVAETLALFSENPIVSGIHENQKISLDDPLPQ